MTPEEVNTIINLPNINADGKFDYIKVCNLHIIYILVFPQLS